ncbi:ParB N-terminal domain-containing protein, partial [Sansalvadorimonas verongulae]|uniref:ParB N-terminal domain-containing protein n=1 Tax=Sansalvadorimonas verongulae TaxID=2172824 RepID=UPI0018AD17CD
MKQPSQGRDKQPQKWQSRIIGQGVERADQLLANPLNWRKHPKAQQAALKGALNEIGWIQQVIVNKTTGHLVDGHLRVEVALAEGEQDVPVLYVELTEEEEKKALATIDPIAALATTDRKMLDDLVLGLNVNDQDFASLLDTLASQDALNTAQEGLTDDDAVGEKSSHTVCESGDVWCLGEHRLLCGDGTDQSCVAQLMDGE